MKCKKCNSTDLVPETSSGYSGFRCFDCAQWHYDKEFEPVAKIKKEKVEK